MQLFSLKIVIKIVFPKLDQTLKQFTWGFVKDRDLQLHPDLLIGTSREEEIWIVTDIQGILRIKQV